jgi:DNA-directed RNA polymerase specialized sigma24 family protein
MPASVLDERQSISRWIDGLKQGDSQAAELIWQEYFEKLVRLARQRLGSLPRRVADEEDLALSALNSVILGAKDQKFPRLADRTDLWKLLVVVTSRKAIARQRKHFAAKRPDRKMVYGPGSEGTDDASWLSQVLGREPSPEFAAEFAEEVQRLLTVLPSDDFRQVALLRMEGYTNREIAGKLGWYEVKVERRLRIIRKQWSSSVENIDE